MNKFLFFALVLMISVACLSKSDELDVLIYDNVINIESQKRYFACYSDSSSYSISEANYKRAGSGGLEVRAISADEGRIEAVIIETQSGRELIRGVLSQKDYGELISFFERRNHHLAHL
ncbi:MAG: hypothetical protein ACSHYA_08215 [Opitutaceae bacterium]